MSPVSNPKFFFLLISSIFFSITSLTAQGTGSKPNELCSETDRKELIEQFKKFELDVKFAEDFCDRFAPGVKLRPQSIKIESPPLKATEKIPQDQGNKPLSNKEEPTEIADSTNTGIKEPKEIKQPTSSPDIKNEADAIPENPRTEQAEVRLPEKNQIPEKPIKSKDLDTTQKSSANTQTSIPKSNATNQQRYPSAKSAMWEIGIGTTSTNYSENHQSTKLNGRQYRASLKSHVAEDYRWGIVQAYRSQTGSVGDTLFSRDLYWEQWQLGFLAEIFRNFRPGFELSLGLVGGWEENRLIYTYEDKNLIYFSDLYRNGQPWFGLQFSTSYQVTQKFMIGFGIDFQPVTNKFSTQENTTGTLSNRMSFTITANFLTN